MKIASIAFVLFAVASGATVSSRNDVTVGAGTSIEKEDGKMYTEAELEARLELGTNSKLSEDDVRKKLVEAIASGKRDGANADREFSKEVVSEDRIEIKSKSRNGTSSSSFSYGFTVDGYPRWKLAFRSKDEDTLAGFAFRVGLIRLVEYNSIVAPEDSKHFLDFKRDVASKSDQGSGKPSWSSVRSGLQKEVDANDASVVTVSTMLDFDNHEKFQNLRVNLTTQVADRVTISKDQAPLTPAGLKYTIVIENFPFTMANSKLALVNAFWQRSGKISRANLESSSMASIADGDGQFTWASQVEADGEKVEVDVLSNVKEDERSIVADANAQSDSDTGKVPKLIVFGLPKADKITWDPYMAANDQSVEDSGASGRSSMLVSSFIGAVALLATAYF